MVMENSLPPSPPTHKDSRLKTVTKDGNYGNPRISSSTPVSSNTLLSPKAGVTKKSPDGNRNLQSQAKSEPVRRTVSKSLFNASEKAPTVVPERLRKKAAEKSRKRAITDNSIQEKRELEALVRRLSTPNTDAHRQPVMVLQEKAQKNGIKRGENKNAATKCLPGQCESKELGVHEEIGTSRLEAPRLTLTAPSPTQDVLLTRISQCTNQVDRASHVCLNEAGKDAALTLPLTAAKMMSLMPIPAIDDMMKEEMQDPNSQFGAYLIKLTKVLSLEEDQSKAIEYGTRAVKFYEKQADDGQSILDFIASLQILAALHGRLGNYKDAISLLERSVAIPLAGKSEDHALAKFSGYMQLGDSYSIIGKQDSALNSYHTALRVQKEMLGDLNLEVGDTCHYIAEAHLQALEFDEAEALCEHALAVRKEHGVLGSLEEAADRRLLALVLNAKGNHDKALENLVLACEILQAHSLEIDTAELNFSIGDELLLLGRETEAVTAYQKAILLFKCLKGDNHTLVAGCYVSLAELYVKTNRPREAKLYCESALHIYGKQESGHNPSDIASGLADVAAVYEQMNVKDTTIVLLQQALRILESIPGQQAAMGGIEAQIGILYYMMGKFMPALDAFKSATNKLKDSGFEKTPLLGMLLNQMGITSVELGNIVEAVALFERSWNTLKDTCGPHHADTLDVCTNLAGGYNALGRLSEASKLLEETVQVKEEKFGLVHPDVVSDRKQLQELFKNMGSTYVPKSQKLEELLLHDREENCQS